MKHYRYKSFKTRIPGLVATLESNYEKFIAFRILLEEMGDTRWQHNRIYKAHPRI